MAMKVGDVGSTGGSLGVVAGILKLDVRDKVHDLDSWNRRGLIHGFMGVGATWMLIDRRIRTLPAFELIDEKQA